MPCAYNLWKRKLGGGGMGAFLSDVRTTLRGLQSSPGLALAVSVTLGLGIAAVTLMFSVANAVLLRSLSLPQSDRLVQLFTCSHGSSRDASSQANLVDYRQRIEALESVAGFRWERLHLGSGDEPRIVLGIAATPELFEVLGVQLEIGRPFTLEEAQPGSPPAVAVISHSLWRRLFSASPTAIGSEIRVEGLPIRVVGVLPAALRYPHPEVEIWYPQAIEPGAPGFRENHYLQVLGRVRDGVPVARAQDEVRAYGAQIVHEFPENYATYGFATEAVPLLEAMVGSSRRPLLLLLGAVALVLLIACANVASLLLVRAQTRRRELALRSALGASGPRILSLVVSEALILALAGCALGVCLAAAARPALMALAAGVPRIDEVTLDVRLMVVVVVTSLVAGLLAVGPAVSVLRADAGRLLCSGGRSLSASHQRQTVRRWLVTAEVALAVVLVGGAGLMMRSVNELLQFDLGIRTDHVLTMWVNMPHFQAEEPARVGTVLSSMVERVAAVADVRAVGVARELPLASRFGRWSIQVEGHEVESIGEAAVTNLLVASPGALEAMGIHVVKGRNLKPTDRAGNRLVALANRRFVREVLADRDPIGARVSTFDPDWPWMEIVGVVPDLHHEGPEVPVRPLLVVPFDQAEGAGLGNETSAALVLRTDGDPRALAATVVAMVRQIEPLAAVRKVRTMGEIRTSVSDERRLPMIVLGAFATLALVLAAVGIAGLVAMVVKMRDREIGIRLALGGRIEAVRAMVVREGMRPVLLGLVVGTVGLAAASRLFGGLIFNIRPYDPAALACTVLVLGAVAWVATLVPSRRVRSSEPAQLLRTEE